VEAAHLGTRVALARAQMRALDVDAFVITHTPNVAWLTGFFSTSAAIVLTGRRLVLLTDFRYEAAAEHARLSGQFPEDTEVAITDRSLDEALVATIADVGSEVIGVEGDHLSVRRFRRLESLAPKGRRFLPVEPFLERLRAVKDAAEIAIFREGAARLAEVFTRVPPLLTPGRTEQAVAAEMDHLLRLGGFERSAFETIVASGPNSARPHARPTGRTLEAGDPVVLDFGGVYKGYCLDLTRTAFIGQPPESFLRQFDAVAAAQAAAISAVRDGVHASDVDAAARELLAARDLGEAFGHATGHGLGLEVHEYPRIGRRPSDGDDPVLRTGMILTIEPGAYVPATGGVRIEDDVLVGPRGAEVLTDIPRALIDPGAR